MLVFLSFLSFLLSFLITWQVKSWFTRHAILELPNHRSSHTVPTPKSGGLGFVVATMLTGIALASWLYYKDLWSINSLLTSVGLLGLGGLLAFTGFKDDLKPLSARLRLAVQSASVIASLLLIQPLLAVSFPWFTWQTGFLLIPITLFGMWWINAFNFMDGIDGIAVLQGIFVLAALLVFHLSIISVTPILAFMLLLLAALFGFILLNWPPAKIFMGDVGSYFLGFMLFIVGLLVVKLVNGSYWTWFILNAMFLIDTFVTLIRRLAAGHRYSEAHRNHFYQKLSRAKKSHLYASLFYLAINIGWLFPLAWLAEVGQQKFGLYYFLIAYTPLFALFIIKGAGKDESILVHIAPSTKP